MPGFHFEGCLCIWCQQVRALNPAYEYFSKDGVGGWRLVKIEDGEATAATHPVGTERAQVAERVKAIISDMSGSTSIVSRDQATDIRDTANRRIRDIDLGKAVGKL